VAAISVSFGTQNTDLPQEMESCSDMFGWWFQRWFLYPENGVMVNDDISILQGCWNDQPVIDRC
jgi:hypothetical protein